MIVAAEFGGTAGIWLPVRELSRSDDSARQGAPSAHEPKQRSVVRLIVARPPLLHLAAIAGTAASRPAVAPPGAPRLSYSGNS